MSARSYEILFSKKQDNISLSVEFNELIVKLHGNKIIKLNMFTGVLKVSDCGYPTPTTVTTINRFLFLIDCKRYSASRSSANGIVVTDNTSRVSHRINAEYKMIVVPTRCVVSTIAKCSINSYMISTWASKYKEYRYGSPVPQTTTNNVPF